MSGRKEGKDFLQSLKRAALFGLIVAVVLKPNQLDPVLWQNAPAPAKFEGPSAVNCDLCEAELLYRGDLPGPESVVFDSSGRIYVSLGDGTVRRLPQPGSGLGQQSPETIFFSGGFVAQNGSSPLGLIGEQAEALLKKCQTLARAHQVEMSPELAPCGRPLGMRIKGSDLYLADAYFGIFKVELQKGKATWLTGPSQLPASFAGEDPVASMAVQYYDDLDLSKDGSKLYFTDASYKHQATHTFLEILDGTPRGRVLELDLKTLALKTVACGLHFPNAVQVTADGKALLVGECTRMRILKISLSEVTKGFGSSSSSSALASSRQFCGERADVAPGLDVWAEGLPGQTDNIRLTPDSKHNTVAFPARAVKPFSTQHFLYQHPFVTRWILGKLFPVKHTTKLAPKHSFVGVFDLEGNLVRALHDPSGNRLPKITEANIHPQTGAMYLGSFVNMHLGRVSFNI